MRNQTWTIGGSGYAYIQNQHRVKERNSQINNSDNVLPLIANFCDIAYWDGSAVKTIAKDKYTTNLGDMIGMVVIPTGMLPDGKARIVSLNYSDDQGNPVSYPVYMYWGNSDTSVKYSKVPITDNTDVFANSTDNWGRLPSNIFNGEQSFIDPNSKYCQADWNERAFIPSPYLNNTLNPEYCKNSDTNPLSDFNGLNNTIELISFLH